jgi:hypothetical protein
VSGKSQAVRRFILDCHRIERISTCVKWNVVQEFKRNLDFGMEIQ